MQEEDAPESSTSHNSLPVFAKHDVSDSQEPSLLSARSGQPSDMTDTVVVVSFINL